MNASTDKRHAGRERIVRLFVRILVMILLSEAAIMVSFYLLGVPKGLDVVLDPLLLAGMVTPFLYRFIVTPLRDSNAMMVEALEGEKRAAMGLERAMQRLEAATREAHAATDAKSEFLANMSHEIRTPMTAILGFTDILLEQGNLGSATPEWFEAAHTIKRNGKYLLAIINDILYLSKIEAGALEVERIQCSPVNLVAEVKSLMQVHADTKRLYFNTEYLGPIPETILSDPTRVKQVLLNLIGNAIKFTENGGVRLVTRYVETGPGTPVLQFDVIDTGIGLTEEQLSRLFRPFTQADSSTTRRFGGTGLGLIISKRLAEKLGGGITVTSAPGEGSNFRVTIATGPLEGVKMLDDPASATEAKPEVSGAAPSGRVKLECRILLAEDGADNQRLISFVLKKAGAEVAIVGNGRQAVDAALAAREAGNPFDVILMDIQMPVMDGREATALLRREGYTGAIIALTAHAMASDREDCLSVGCDDYATKPIDRPKLIQAISEHVNRSRETIPASAD